MAKKIHSKWLTQKETRIYCIDFSGLGSDHQGLKRELTASQAVIYQQKGSSLLVTVDISQTEMMPELVQFFRDSAGMVDAPIRKMAILGVSDFQKVWLRLVKKVTWPGNAVFFRDYESAKNWLVGEGF